MAATDAIVVPPQRPSPARAAVTATLWWLLHAVLGGALLAALLGVVPRFAATFADFDVELPAAAMLAIQISRICARGALLVIPAALVVLVVDWVVLYLLQSRRRTVAAALWAVFWALLLLAVASLMVVGVVLPMLNLMENLA